MAEPILAESNRQQWLRLWWQRRTAILPTTTSTTNQSAVSHSTALYLNGQNYNFIRYYSGDLTGSSNGCDSVATLNLTICQQPPVQRIQTFARPTVYTWNGQTYNEQVLIHDTTGSIESCVILSQRNPCAILPTTTSINELHACSTQLPCT